MLNRLYYATFHAAQATLYVRGLTPSSHGQVRQQFGQHVVLEGDASRRQGRLLSTLYDYRQQADYIGYSPAVDISKLVASVDDFLTHAEALVGSENE